MNTAERQTVPRAKKNYFESISSMTKSKLGELLLCVADSELQIEK